jgi:tight adherence protein B
MAQFVSLYTGNEGERTPSVTDLVFGGAERSLERASWWPRFKEKLEIAEIRMPAVQIVLWTVGVTLFTMWLLAALGGSVIYSPLGLFVPFAVRGVIRRKLERKRRLFGEQLPDSLQVLASALRAGHSFVGALSVVVDDAPEPTRSEFQRVVADEQLGVPLEDALEVVVRRMDNDDLEQVALVAALQRETGGNSAEVLDRVTEVVRNRIELRLLIKSLTAQGRLSRWVVTFLPVALMGAIMLLNPGYLHPLFSTTFGQVLLTMAAAMVILGSLAIKKIVDIKV